MDIKNGVSMANILKDFMSKISVDYYGTLIWKNAKGDPHRVDGPAVIWPNGTKSWYINGKRHRTDGPASVCPNGDQYWYHHGRLIK